MSGNLTAWRTRLAVERARARGESVEAIAQDLGVDPLLVADLWAVQDDIAAPEEMLRDTPKRLSNLRSDLK